MAGKDNTSNVGSFRDFEIDPKYGRIHAWRERFSKRPSANLDG